MIKVLGKSWYQFVVALLIISILALPGMIGFTTASAANTSGVTKPTKEIPVITGEDAAQYENTLIKLADSQGISAEYQLNKDDMVVQDLDAALGNGIIGASIRIIDNTGQKRISYFAALFNKKDGTLIKTIAVVFKKDGKLYEGTYIENGTKMLCLTMKENGDTVKGYKVNPDGTTTNFTPGQIVNPQMSVNNTFWNCFSSCLSSSGVATWVVAMIGAVCTSVCEDFPNPPGCAACAVATVIGLESIAYYCLYECW
jgi:hypothetical protein